MVLDRESCPLSEFYNLTLLMMNASIILSCVIIYLELSCKDFFSFFSPLDIEIGEQPEQTQPLIKGKYLHIFFNNA